jgi:hypothetical protein
MVCQVTQFKETDDQLVINFVYRILSNSLPIFFITHGHFFPLKWRPYKTKMINFFIKK